MGEFASMAMIATAWVSFATGEQQTLYRETDNGWYVYVEERSCVAYVDYANGEQEITFRFSNRTDENRLYITAYGSYFEPLREGIGESVMIGVGFDSVPEFQSSVGMVIRNPDASMGVTGNSFDREELLRLLSTRRTLELRVYPNAIPSVNRRVMQTPMNLGPFPLDGASIGVMHLQECTDRHFPASR